MESTRQDRALGEAATGRLPDFIVIGAMKSGTTSLYEYLRRHPSVFMPRGKEPMFFSRDPVYAKGIGWYKSLFAGALTGQVCGEASTCYTRLVAYPLAAERIAAACPGVKLIYLMRHPVDRAYSHYAHEMAERHALGTGPMIPFDRALEEIEEILDAGRYEHQLEPYDARFGAGSVLPLTLDEMKRDAAGLLDRVQRFIGVEPADLCESGPILANESGGKMVEMRTRRAIRRVRRVPGIRWLVDRMPASARGATLRRMERAASDAGVFGMIRNRWRRGLAPMNDAMRERLLAYYRPTVDAMERRLGLGLGAWRR